MFDSPSCPLSIEDMDCQWRAGRSREERSARVEVESTTNHNEKEQKQANHQRALFSLCEHRNPPMRQGFRLFQLHLSSITYWLKSPLCQRGLRFAVPPHLASADRPDGAFANSAREYSRCN